MDNIKRYACNPPVEHHCKATDEKVRYRAKRTEEQSEKSGYKAIDKHRIGFSHTPCDKCQQRPCIDVHYPPQTKAVKAAFDKYKCRYNKQHFAAQHQGEHHNPEGCGFHIRYALQCNLAYLDNCNRHANKCYITGCKFFVFSQIKSHLSLL